MENHSSASVNGGKGKVKLMCSYGGKIQSRPSDHHLFYVAGDTKILAVDRNIKFSEMLTKLDSLCRKERGDLSVKYQLPGENLDSLISLIDDEDVQNMMVEYDRTQRINARIRLFVFDVSATRSARKDSGSGPVTPSNPDYLFGFDKDYQPSVGPPLDLLQIPGMILPESCGNGQVEGKIGISESGGVGGNGTAAGQAFYRVPAGVNGGVYRSGRYANGVMPEMVAGNRENQFFNIVPVMPLMPERKMMVTNVNSLMVKGNQGNF